MAQPYRYSTNSASLFRFHVLAQGHGSIAASGVIITADITFSKSFQTPDEAGLHDAFGPTRRYQNRRCSLGSPMPGIVLDPQARSMWD